MANIGSNKKYGIDELKGLLVPIRAKFKPLGLILADWECFEGWSVVFVVDWEERIVRVTARFGSFVSRREHEDALEQTFCALAAARNYKILLIESDPARRGYQKRILNACQEEMIGAGRAAQDLLDAALGVGEVDEDVKQAVRAVMIHPSNREGEWEGEWTKSQSFLQLTL